MSSQPRLAEALKAAQKILVFSGAGISTGSGIPDFRGPNGVWKKRQPVYFDEFMASEEKRVEYWGYKAEGHDVFFGAQPNAAHKAIVHIEEAGRLQAVVTQNIDGLHQMAGSSNVHEVHGTNRYIECVQCGARGQPGPAVKIFRTSNACPLCEGCGGYLKFATISFGQQLRPEVIAKATAEAKQADCVLALGSTLSVAPANQLPLVAAARGAPYIIINRGQTDHDHIATMKIDGDVVELLPQAVAGLELC